MTELPIFGPGDLAPGETLEPRKGYDGRFYIKCPDGKERLYTRTTTFIDVLEDKSQLEKWRNRVILVGLHQDPQILVEVARTDPLDKDAMNKLSQRAFEAGDGHLKAQKGTDLHRLTYLWDMLLPIPPLTDADQADLHSYVGITNTSRFKGYLHREHRVVVDHLKVTGTPDGVVTYECLDGVVRNVIIDIKTGRVDYGAGKMAQQLRIYAEGELYTDDGSDTGLREPLPDVSKEIGLILELPQGGAINGVKPVLYEVDLNTGWYGANLSKQVRSWRNWSKKCFTEVPLS